MVDAVAARRWVRRLTIALWALLAVKAATAAVVYYLAGRIGWGVLAAGLLTWMLSLMLATILLLLASTVLSFFTEVVDEWKQVEGAVVGVVSQRVLFGFTDYGVVVALDKESLTKGPRIHLAAMQSSRGAGALYHSVTRVSPERIERLMKKAAKRKSKAGETVG